MQKTLEDYGAKVRVRVAADTACIAKPLPEVRRAVREAEDRDFSELFLEVCARLKKLAHADGYEVTPTSGATHALQIALVKYVPVRGRTVITTDREYNGIVKTLEEAGAKIEVVPYSAGLAGRFKAAMEKSHGAVVFISDLTRYGEAIPVKEICSHAKELGIPVIVDGAQGIGRLEVNLDETKPDIYLASGHKALRAPEGTGALYVSKELLGRLGLRGISNGETHNKGLLAGLSEAIRLREEQGEGAGQAPPALEAGLRGIPGVKVAGSSAGIVTFMVEGAAATAVHDALEQEGVACTADEATGIVRVSVDAYSRPEEVAAITEVVRETADRLNRLMEMRLS